ncbi:hypothetical protein GCM10027074_53440 [Streptomyces deserti]
MVQPGAEAARGASLATAEAAADAPGGDLPDGDLPADIGRPTARALFGAGLTTLEQVARRSEAGLLALHGVGPTAARILPGALERRGLSLRR